MNLQKIPSLDDELRKHTTYIALSGELCGIFSEFFEEKIPRHIESAL